jgi:hypothetical protein
MITSDRQAATATVEAFRLQTHRTREDLKPTYVVEALGREFAVSDEMARIFLRQVERVLDSDESALVILRHHHGIELLLITDDSSFTIRAADRPHGPVIDESAPSPAP